MTGASLDRAVAERVSAAIGEYEVVGTVGGGSVSQVLRLRTSSSDYLLKTHPGGAAMFLREAEGVEALRAVRSGLRLPEVAAVCEDEEGVPGWILLEWIGRGHPTDVTANALGRGLARLHRSTNRPEPGWACTTFIGPYPQDNSPVGDWPGFWRERRLRPQVERAAASGYQPGPAEEWERLFARLDDLLAPAHEDGCSLLHGDLWSGNVLEDRVGRPVLIDPAIYRGHREVDLAMMELFGGFPEDAFAAYREAWPLLDGYPRRRPIYQLYYLLVHLNLFGRGFLSRTRAALQRSLRG